MNYLELTFSLLSRHYLRNEKYKKKRGDKTEKNMMLFLIRFVPHLKNTLTRKMWVELAILCLFERHCQIYHLKYQSRLI